MATFHSVLGRRTRSIVALLFFFLLLLFALTLAHTAPTTTPQAHPYVLPIMTGTGHRCTCHPRSYNRNICSGTVTAKQTCAIVRANKSCEELECLAELLPLLLLHILLLLLLPVSRYCNSSCKVVLWTAVVVVVVVVVVWPPTPTKSGGSVTTSVVTYVAAKMVWKMFSRMEAPATNMMAVVKAISINQCCSLVMAVEDDDDDDGGGRCSSSTISKAVAVTADT